MDVRIDRLFADVDMDTTDETRASELPDGLTNRELDLLGHYTDPASPGYRNATRSAELAGYKGLPSSNQLSVQGSRTLRKARELGVLRAILTEKGCTLDHAAERLAACLDAKRTRVFMTKDGKIIKSEPEDDHHQQRLAAKLVFQLHGAFDGASRQELSPAAACHETGRAADQEQVSAEHRSAMAILSESDAVDRELLRDVLECDAKSVEFEAREPHGGTAEQYGQGPVLEGNSSKA
jgi:hypothetical protein